MSNKIHTRITTDESRFMVGMHAPEFIVHLIDVHKEIETLVLMSYRVAPGLERRLAANKPVADDAIFQQSLKLARDRQVPLWIALMNSYLEAQGVTADLIKEALVHDKKNEREFRLRRDQVNLEVLNSIVDNLDPDFALGVGSRVELSDGRTRHIPMIDLRCSKSEENVKTLNHLFHEIGQKKGVLLDSGRSYHYYGLELLDDQDWLRFMGRCLLLTPLVDTRYIAHRLIDGYGRLRVSKSRDKPAMPTVVDVYEQ